MTISALHIILAFEIFLLHLFCVPLPVLNSGNALGILFSCVLIGYTLCFESMPKSLCIGGTAVLSATVLILLDLTVKMFIAARNTPPEGTPCTVIILGCRVRGNRPTRMLRRRLETAYEFLKHNPDSVCVVSGGKGTDEIISESAAMKAYLKELGLNEERIFTEDKSKSTLENFRLSKAVIDDYSLPTVIAAATDGFHQYRAAMLAKRCGMKIYAVSAKTEPRYAPTYWVREWLGIVAYNVKKNAQ